MTASGQAPGTTPQSPGTRPPLPGAARRQLRPLAGRRQEALPRPLLRAGVVGPAWGPGTCSHGWAATVDPSPWGATRFCCQSLEPGSNQEIHPRLSPAVVVEGWGLLPETPRRGGGCPAVAMPPGQLPDGAALDGMNGKEPRLKSHRFVVILSLWGPRKSGKSGRGMPGAGGHRQQGDTKERAGKEKNDGLQGRSDVFTLNPTSLVARCRPSLRGRAGTLGHPPRAGDGDGLVPHSSGRGGTNSSCCYIHPGKVFCFPETAEGGQEEDSWALAWQVPPCLNLSHQELPLSRHGSSLPQPTPVAREFNWHQSSPTFKGCSY